MLSLFFLTFNFEIIINLQEIVKMVRRGHMYLLASFPVATSYVTTGQYQTQEFDISTIFVHGVISFYHICRLI